VDWDPSSHTCVASCTGYTPQCVDLGGNSYTCN
jgi:hypothetical protein